MLMKKLKKIAVRNPGQLARIASDITFVFLAELRNISKHPHPLRDPGKSMHHDENPIRHGAVSRTLNVYVFAEVHLIEYSEPPLTARMAI